MQNCLNREVGRGNSQHFGFFRVCSIFIKTDEKINQKRRYLPNTHSDKGLKRNFCSIFLGHFIEECFKNGLSKCNLKICLELQIDFTL